MKLSRRSLLKAVPAIAAAPVAIAGPARAAAPFANTQAPGLVHRKVGSAQVTALLDGYFGATSDTVVGFGDAAVDAALSDYGQGKQDGAINLPINSFAVNAGGKLSLIDAGAGVLFAPTMGAFDEGLAAAGIGVEDVDRILLTHMHVDHVGGLLNDDGSARFPHAELVVSKTEWEFWWNDAIMNSDAAKPMLPFFQGARVATGPYKDRVTLFDGETDLGQGVTSLPLPGHTPGHTGFVLNSEDDAVLFWGDIIHVTGLQFTNPEYLMVFDMDPEQTLATRRRMFDMAASDGLLLAGSHIDFPGLGRVRRDGDGYRYQPAPWPYTV